MPTSKPRRVHYRRLLYAAKPGEPRMPYPAANRRLPASATGYAAMKDHEFTLVLTGIPELTSQVLDALFEAGCDDATPSIQGGVVRLDFDRQAATLKDAILSAIRNVRDAKIDADVYRVDVDGLVTQSNIARKIGRTRQVVNQYVTGQRGPGGFPPPVYHVHNKSPLWEWAQVARWLQQNDMVTEEDLREAQEAAVINNALELRQHRRELDNQLVEEVLETVGS